MAFGVLLADVVGVVGADHGNACFLMDLQKLAVYLCLLPYAVILQFEIKIVLPEKLLHLQGILFCTLIVSVEDPLGDLAGQTRRQGDQPLRVRPKQLQINAGLYIKPLHKSLAHHVGQIPIARFILAQQHQMPGFGIIFMDLVKPCAGGHIDLASDDGVNALRLAGSVKINGAVHHAVIRDGAGSLPHLLDALRQVADAAGAVQKAVFRMYMQVYE